MNQGGGCGKGGQSPAAGKQRQSDINPSMPGGRKVIWKNFALAKKGCGRSRVYMVASEETPVQFESTVEKYSVQTDARAWRSDYQKRQDRLCHLDEYG